VDVRSVIRDGEGREDECPVGEDLSHSRVVRNKLVIFLVYPMNLWGWSSLCFAMNGESLDVREIVVSARFVDESRSFFVIKFSFN
jgi:hypothetical protein